jgi:hypothetical protein
MSNRFDIYVGIHKALRSLMSDTLARLGRCDLDHEADLHDTLDRVAHTLSLLAGHLDSENQVLHTAIEARLPEGARQTIDDHAEHVQSIAALSDDIQALRQAPFAQRAPMALRLYRHLALFVAENLEHMNVEETNNNATLWSLFTDAEIAQLEGQIVGRLSPEKRAAFLRWFAISLSTQELTGFLQAMQQAAPPEAFQASLSTIRAELDPGRWDRLATALAVHGAAPASRLAPSATAVH